VNRQPPIKQVTAGIDVSPNLRDTFLFNGVFLRTFVAVPRLVTDPRPIGTGAWRKRKYELSLICSVSSTPFPRRWKLTVRIHIYNDMQLTIRVDATRGPIIDYSRGYALVPRLPAE
jgi:hypothetical protein